MKAFKVFYDQKADVLYLGKKGEEEEIVELAPGINVELDGSGELIGVELFHASTLLKDVIKPMERKILAA